MFTDNNRENHSPLDSLLMLGLLWVFFTGSSDTNNGRRASNENPFSTFFAFTLAIALGTLFITVPAMAVIQTTVTIFGGSALSVAALSVLFVFSGAFRSIVQALVSSVLFVAGSLILSFASAVDLIAEALVLTVDFAFKAANSLLNTFYAGLRVAIFPVRWFNDAMERRFVRQINQERAPEGEKRVFLNLLLTMELGVAVAATSLGIVVPIYVSLISIIGPGLAYGAMIGMSLINLHKLNAWREDRLRNFNSSVNNGEVRENWADEILQAALNMNNARTTNPSPRQTIFGGWFARWFAPRSPAPVIPLHAVARIDVQVQARELSIFEFRDEWAGAMQPRDNALRPRDAANAKAAHVKTILGSLRVGYKLDIFGNQIIDRNTEQPVKRLVLEGMVKTQVEESHRRIGSNTDGFWGALNPQNTEHAATIAAVEATDRSGDLTDIVTAGLYHIPVYVEVPIPRTQEDIQLRRTRTKKERNELSSLLQALADKNETPDSRTQITNPATQIHFDTETYEIIQRKVHAAQPAQSRVWQEAERTKNFAPVLAMLNNAPAISDPSKGLIDNSVEFGTAFVKYNTNTDGFCTALNITAEQMTALEALPENSDIKDQVTGHIIHNDCYVMHNGRRYDFDVLGLLQWLTEHNTLPIARANGEAPRVISWADIVLDPAKTRDIQARLRAQAARLAAAPAAAPVLATGGPAGASLQERAVANEGGRVDHNEVRNPSTMRSRLLQTFGLGGA